jgi:hypothetical protein
VLLDRRRPFLNGFEGDLAVAAVLDHVVQRNLPRFSLGLGP